MDIRDFMDVSKLQEFQEQFSTATGLSAVVIDLNGEYITEPSNPTDFCMKCTRGSAEGARRCNKSTSGSTGLINCHAGLMEFATDITVDGKKVAIVVAGQIFPKEPDEAKFRSLAEELGIDPDTYIRALHKVPVSDEKRIRAAVELFGLLTNELVNSVYSSQSNTGILDKLSDEINRATSIIETINNNTHSLKSIASKQKMLSLNASIEAARSGEAGVGFAVVAKSMGDLSSQSSTIYGDIEKSVIEVTASIEKIASIYNEQ